MKNRIKALSLIIALMIFVLCMSFAAYATGEVAPVSPPADTPVVDEPVDNPPVDTPVDDPVDEPVDDPVDEPVDTPVETSVAEAPVVEETIDDTVTDPDTTGSYVDQYTDDDGYYYYDEDQMVQSIDDTAGSVSDYTTLYNTSNYSDAELQSSKWNNISLNISDSGTDDAGDFTAIKENKDIEDNGEWILYLGVALIGLAILGILYFAVATATYKKKLKSLRERDARQRRRAMEREHSREELDDDFYIETVSHDRYRSPQTRTRRRYASDNSLSYAERKRMMRSDTADIYIPR